MYYMFKIYLIIFSFYKLSISLNIFKNYCKIKPFYINYCKKKQKKIIVSMTSWPKRINNVPKVLKSIINQTTPPDLIELNLCETEFPNKENDLPNELNSLLNKYKKIEINWIKNNTYTFKKIIPTLKKFYGNNYYLLSIDDDWIYRNDYISMMINYLNQYNSDSFCLGGGKIIGSVTIYK